MPAFLRRPLSRLAHPSSGPSVYLVLAPIARPPDTWGVRVLAACCCMKCCKSKKPTTGEKFKWPSRFAQHELHIPKMGALLALSLFLFFYFVFMCSRALSMGFCGGTVVDARTSKSSQPAR